MPLIVHIKLEFQYFTSSPLRAIEIYYLCVNLEYHLIHPLLGSAKGVKTIIPDYNFTESKCLKRERYPIVWDGGKKLQGFFFFL